MPHLFAACGLLQPHFWFAIFGHDHDKDDDAVKKEADENNKDNENDE